MTTVMAVGANSPSSFIKAIAANNACNRATINGKPKLNRIFNANPFIMSVCVKPIRLKMR